MAFLAYPSTTDCSLLVDSSAIGRHPEFFANLLSGCEIVDANGAVVDPLDVWRAVREQRISPLLDTLLTEAVPMVFAALIHEGVVAIKCSSGRAQEVCTLFYEREGGLRVRKHASRLDERGACVLLQAGPEEKVHPGIAFDFFIYQCAIEREWPKLREALTMFIGVAFQRFAAEDSTLIGLAVDAIPRNSVMDSSGALEFFDLEFADYGKVARSFFIYRVCISLMTRRAKLFAGAGFSCLYEVYLYLCQQHDVSPALRQDVSREAAFQARVQGRSPKKPRYYRVLRPFARHVGLATRLRLLAYRIQIGISAFCQQ